MNDEEALTLPTEVALGRLAVMNELLSQDQVDACMEELKRLRDGGADGDGFEDVAIGRGLLSREEASALSTAYQRIKRDAEKKKWAVQGYEIFSKIGEGGLGVVFKARQISMNRVVALKILHRRWTSDDEFRKRFLYEARLVGKLSHQNLIKVFDVGKEDWKYYFSMEFVEGETLDDRIRRLGKVPVLPSVDLTLQVLRAIRYIQQFGVVHCDIKPSNVMIGPDGVAKLGDFGFVKSSLEIKPAEEGTVLGTPDYISPEQAMGQKDIDFRSDIYSLGVSLYHMVTGVTPFEGSVSAVMRKHIREAPPPPREKNPEVPENLARIIERMMAKDPLARYQSCDALFEDLEIVKIREKMAEGHELGAPDLERVLAQEKGRRLGSEAASVELSVRLRRMTLLFWMAVALLFAAIVVILLLVATR